MFREARYIKFTVFLSSNDFKWIILYQTHFSHWPICSLRPSIIITFPSQHLQLASDFACTLFLKFIEALPLNCSEFLQQIQSEVIGLNFVWTNTMKTHGQ